MSQEDIGNKFIADNNNKSVEVEDASALDQCMDLAFKYCDVLGIDRAAIRHAYAYQVWAQPNEFTRKYFDLIENTPTFIPRTGDLAVFKIINGIPIGHISIVAPGSDINNLVSFGQNWDTLHYYHLDSFGNHIPYCRTVVHYAYYGVAGFLRPKLTTQPVGDDILVNKIKTVIDSSASPHDKIVQIKAILV